jgi:hypothetical protein
MAHEDEPSLPESFWTALRRDEPQESAMDRAYFRFTIARSFRRSRPRGFQYLVFGFVAGVAAVSAAASGRYWLLRWLPLVPHESRASGAPAWSHRSPASGVAPSSPAASSSAPAAACPSRAP